MEKIWIVVADGVRARLFQAEKRTGPLIERKDIANPDARLPERELVTDTRGRGNGGATSERRHAYGEDYDEHDRQRAIFAKDLAKRLEKLRAKGELELLYVIAEPGFLGLLRGEMGKQLTSCVKGELHQRITNEKVEEIRELLPKDMRGLGG